MSLVSCDENVFEQSDVIRESESVLPLVGHEECESKSQKETSSATNRGHLVVLPKKGFLSKLNLRISRFFISKL